MQPSEVDVEPEPPAPSRPEQQFKVETCSISRWRGYVTSSFIALLSDGTPVAGSPEFRCRGRAAAADDGLARSAHNKLRAELIRLGWEETDARPETWYAGQFIRLVEAKSASVPEAAVPVFEPLPVIELARRPLLEAAVLPPAPPRVEPPIEPEPDPIDDAPMLPPAGHIAEEAPGRSRLLTVASVLGLVVALTVGAYLIFSPGSLLGVRSQTVPVSAAKPKRAAPAPATAAPVPARPTAPGSVHVAITAYRRTSWLEVRRVSATGTVLFTGDLSPGRTLHLAGRRLWARFGAAGNLTITANGRPVRLLGTYEHIFVVKP